MFAIPLIRTDDESNMTPIERKTIGLDAVITSLVMHANINDPKASQDEIETFRTLSVAIIIPAEA